MEHVSDNTYYTLIADRAGNTYAFAFSGMEKLSDDLLKYINGEISTGTAAVLFQYAELVYQITLTLAQSVYETNHLETSKLLCWLQSQYSNIKGIPFFKDKKIKRDISTFCDYFSSLTESALCEDRTYHAIERRLRSIFPNICLEYTNWDYLYEIKKISTDAADIEPEEE